MSGVETIGSLVENRFILNIDLNSRQRTPFNELNIQVNAVAAMMQVLGADALRLSNGDSFISKNFIASAYDEGRRISRTNASNKELEKWLLHTLKYGEVPAETRIKSRQRYEVVRRVFFSDEDNKIVDTLIEDEPDLYLDEFADRMNILTGRRWADSVIWKQLHKRGYTLQRAALETRQRDEFRVAEYHEHLRRFVAHPRQLIFVDESHRDENAGRRHRAWSLRGRTPQRSEMFGTGSVRYNLIAAADMNGFVEEACDIVLRERDQDDNDLTRGTVDSARFELWVEEFLVPVLGNYQNDEARSVVVLDNAPIHMSPRVDQMIQNAGAIVIPTAPYNPYDNPIEFDFSFYKSTIKRYRNSPYIDAHILALRSVSSKQARAIFKHCKIPGTETWNVNENRQAEEDDDDMMFLLLLMIASETQTI